MKKICAFCLLCSCLCADPITENPPSTPLIYRCEQRISKTPRASIAPSFGIKRAFVACTLLIGGIAAVCLYR